jgi:hypothetical protein
MQLMAMYHRGTVQFKFASRVVTLSATVELPSESAINKNIQVPMLDIFRVLLCFPAKTPNGGNDVLADRENAPETVIRLSTGVGSAEGVTAVTIYTFTE